MYSFTAMRISLSSEVTSPLGVLISRVNSTRRMSAFAAVGVVLLISVCTRSLTHRSALMRSYLDDRRTRGRFGRFDLSVPPTKRSRIPDSPFCLQRPLKMG